jgi:surface polysaccharide O-acyltransferase-like enzyme
MMAKSNSILRNGVRLYSFFVGRILVVVALINLIVHKIVRPV